MLVVCAKNTNLCVCVYFVVHACSCKYGMLMAHICFVLLLEMEPDIFLLLNSVCCIY